MGSGLLILITFITFYALVFGFAAGAIRVNQGGSFGGGFAWGALLGLIGLIVVAATKPPPAPAASAPRAPGDAATSSTFHFDPSVPPPGPQAVRECPHCKESMRRDAGVCPHCRRESEPWQFWEGRWWSGQDAGTQLWYAEQSGTWHSLSEIPVPTARMFDVVVSAIPSDDTNAATRIARIVSADMGRPVEDVLEALKHLPARVVTGAGFGTAEGVRQSISRRGTTAFLEPSVAAAPTAPPKPPPESRPAPADPVPPRSPPRPADASDARPELLPPEPPPEPPGTIDLTLPPLPPRPNQAD